ncbi:hypothetical protein E1B28_006506 [Marasmius oreades]|uniref:MoaB/Mog domain-containing protein n=1 Tax=Marasmius oreades TaxID=181124 RepID=A0A9P7UW70_9AGAR|nr:uncharacterized protein E1B28_006506 [Marasmius oreades]KAG7095806.1 hypothetical protein E1B28_006506 [Marasmius oreades]
MPGKSSVTATATTRLLKYPSARLSTLYQTVPRPSECFSSTSSSSSNPSSTSRFHTGLSRTQNPPHTPTPHITKIQNRSHFIAVMPLSSSTSDPPTMPIYPGHRSLSNSTAMGKSTSTRGNVTAVATPVGSGYGSASNIRRIGVAEEFRRGASTTTNKLAHTGFEVTPVPKTLLEKTKPIRTAACLVIGDEILNGKTMEKNSHYFAKYCFDFGIDLKRVEVIPDDEAEIIAASRRLVEQYDFVVTTGGIGPTHDDITYASLARAFNQNLQHHEETLRRMNEMNKNRAWMASMDAEQRDATKRMALFPEKAEVIFIGRDIWVPVVRLEGKLCVFPGIPALFQKMLDGLTDYLPLLPPSERPLRIQIFTERPESMIAPYLTSLQARLKADGIQVGSYPVLNQGVFVSLIGRDIPSFVGSSTTNGKKLKKGPPRIWLAEVAKEVEREVGGRVVSEEEVAEKKEAAKGFDPAGRPIEPNPNMTSASPLKAKI